MIKTIKNYCVHKEIEYPNEYINSLYMRYDLARYAKKEIDILFSKTINDVKIDKFGFGNFDNVVKILLYKTMINMESAINMGYSLYEITAQIINFVFMEKHLEEHDVAFNKLSKNIKDGEIKRRIESIEKSYEKKYLFSFMNTVKHRKLIDIRYQFAPNKGPIVKEFKYRDHNFKETNYEDVFTMIDRTMENLENLLNSIIEKKEHL
jgi:hypothetical protein